MTQGNSKANDRFEVRKGHYSSGAIWCEIPYVNGKVHGIGKTYYESGALKIETPYVDGKEHGIENWYYESGALRLEAPYVDEYMHGIAKNYDKDNMNIDCLTLYERNREVLVICLESYKATLKPII